MLVSRGQRWRWGIRLVGRLGVAAALALVAVVSVSGPAVAQVPGQDSAVLVGDPGPRPADPPERTAHLVALNATSGPRGENPMGTASVDLYLAFRPGVLRWFSFGGAVTCLSMLENIARITAANVTIEIVDRPGGDIVRAALNQPDCTSELPTIAASGILAPTADVQLANAPAPEVYFVHPAPDAVEVFPNQPVVAAFSEPMDQAATQRAFLLTGPGGGTLLGFFTWLGSRTMIVTPPVNLTQGATYTASVSTAARDLLGNPLVEAKTWSFTITERPVLQAIWPQANATHVPTSTAVVGVFTEEMDQPATAAAISLQEQETGDAVPGSVVWYGPRAAVFLPSAPLEPSTRYVAEVGAGARDEDGNTLANPQRWAFTTTPNAGAARTPSLASPPAAADVGLPRTLRRVIEERLMQKPEVERLERRLRQELRQRG
jgi:Bacterial Ig-like domain